MPNKPNKAKSETRRKENSKPGSDSEDDLHYTPKIRWGFDG